MAETFTSKQQTADIREQIAQDGGPAFPHPQGWRRNPEISDGMSKREWFAGQAVAGILSNDTFLRSIEARAAKKDVAPNTIIADIAFAIADCMVETSQATSAAEGA